MKKFTKLFSLILAITLIISIFPAATTNAAEKTYKLSLTGEYDLDDNAKVFYNYSKMMKNIRLEQVEGTNRWNLTMYAGTTVCLPYTAVATTDKVEVTTDSEYVRGSVSYKGNSGGWIKVTANEKYKQTKTVTNKVLTCKSYNKSGKGLSTLKIVVTVLPYNAKVERTKLVTAKELYKIGYHRDNYSDFAWKNVVGRYPEVLLEDYSPLDSLADHVIELDAHEHKVPQYLYNEFDGKNADELFNDLNAKEGAEVWGYDYDLIRAAISATATGYENTWESTLKEVNDILLTLNLEQYDTDWQKVLEIQKWVKENIKYKIVGNASVKKHLKPVMRNVQVMLRLC